MSIVVEVLDPDDDGVVIVDVSGLDDDMSTEVVDVLVSDLPGPVGPRGPQGIPGPPGPPGTGGTGTGGAEEVAVQPNDPGAGFDLWYDTDAPAVPATFEVTPGDLSGQTIDTDELYRLIMFSNGDVLAIPYYAQPPPVPTGLVATPRINSVRLTWTAVSEAAQYVVFRDGVERAVVSGTLYRDNGVTLSGTYSYNVVAVSPYRLRSGHSSNVSAFIDPALNVAPTVEVTTWPTGTVPLGHKVIVRVNAADVDAQVLARTLGTNVSELLPTSDPSVWIMEPA